MNATALRTIEAAEQCWQLHDRSFHDCIRPLAVEIYFGRMENEDPHTLITRTSLGINYLNQERLTEAADLQGKTPTVNRRVLGEDHSVTGNSMVNVGAV